VGFNFPDTQIAFTLGTMRVEKKKFDDLLGKLLKAKPEPRKKIKTQGKRTSRPILPAKP
jgi:hypothetical protein